MESMHIKCWPFSTVMFQDWENLEILDDSCFNLNIRSHCVAWVLFYMIL